MLRVDSGGSRGILAWIADRPVRHVRELLPRNLTGIRHYLPGTALKILPPVQSITRLMEENACSSRRSPFSKAREPAPGFFDSARRLGQFLGDPDGEEARMLHAAELHAVDAN
jgi:hypothetical protein